jgi:acetate kinase
MDVLVFNAGSSTLKYELFGSDDRTLLRGQVSRIGSDKATHSVGDREQAVDCPDHAAAVRLVLADLGGDIGDVGAVGHRVVHGGPDLWQPTTVDDKVLAALADLIELAPLHNGGSTAAIQAARETMPNVPQVAVFDTGFHHDLPDVARLYALPRDVAERHRIRRYGFHGISCQYLVGRVVELGIAPAARLAICHLGAGASVTAVRDGRSVDTSMGFTPLEGLVMATRAGDLDASLPLYLERNARMSADEIGDLFERESGLLGLSGRSGDYAELERLAGQGDADARLALDLFAYRVRKYLGAYWAALGGIDVVVFSGGIGEHSAGARAAILESMSDVGWRLDPAANADGPSERRISPPGAQPQLWVIPTREEIAIARAARPTLAKSSPRN